jgi:hypothetical protein
LGDEHKKFKLSRTKGCRLNMGRNLSKVSFLSMMNYTRLVNGSIYILQMELKGRVGSFPIYGRLRIMDILTWHGNPTHVF